MMTPDTEPDLAALREFRAPLDEPREGALAKGRWQLARTDGADGAGGLAGLDRPRPRRTWLLAGAGAALAVTVVVGGAAAVQTKRPRQLPQGNAAGTVKASPPTVDLPATHGTKAPMHPAVTGRTGASRAQAVQALTRLAAKQSDGPLVIGPDQVLYVKTYNLDDGDGQSLHELWLDITIDAALRVRRTDDGPVRLDISLSQAEIDEAAAHAESTPPGLDNMNGAYVADFPAGVARVHELSASWRDWAQRTYPGRDADGLIWKQLYEVFHNVDPRLTSDQRLTLYLALLDLPGVQATTATIAGRQYDVVCLAGSAQSAECLLFDPASGRFAGDADPGADMVVTADRFDFVDVGVQPRPAVGTPLPKGSKPVGTPANTPKR